MRSDEDTDPGNSDVATLLDAGVDSQAAIATLAAPESLTDELAVELLALAGVNNPHSVISTLHCSDIVVERNSEWHIAPRARALLLERLGRDENLTQNAHRFLLHLAESPEDRAKFAELPDYLSGTVGRAYHTAAVDADRGLAAYASVATASELRVQWLAARLAHEQELLGVLPPAALEVTFLRGIVAYREGRRAAALRLLRGVAASPERRTEVAIAAHLVGRAEARGGGKRGEPLIRKSLAILRELNDRYGEAQVLNTLGNVLARQRRRFDEAETYLQESLRLGEELDYPLHQAQALHSLGNLLANDRSRLSEAEHLLRRALDLNLTFGNPSLAARVLHSLGRLVSRDASRSQEALDLFGQSLDMDRGSYSQAQVLNSMARVLTQLGRYPEADAALQRSLTLGEQLELPLHRAQVLYSMGQLAMTMGDVTRARSLLAQSLQLNEDAGYSQGVRTVTRALKDLPDQGG